MRYLEERIKQLYTQKNLHLNHSKEARDILSYVDDTRKEIQIIECEMLDYIKNLHKDYSNTSQIYYESCVYRSNKIKKLNNLIRNCSDNEFSEDEFINIDRMYAMIYNIDNTILL
jgi:hypothetical protein